MFSEFWILFTGLDFIMAVALDSTDLDGRRSWPNCNDRMSSLNYNRHKCCVTCRGQDCTRDHKMC